VEEEEEAIIQSRTRSHAQRIDYDLSDTDDLVGGGEFRKLNANNNDNHDDEFDLDDEMFERSKSSKKPATGRGRGRGSTKSEAKTTRGRGGGGGRGSRGAKSSNSKIADSFATKTHAQFSSKHGASISPSSEIVDLDDLSDDEPPPSTTLKSAKSSNKSRGGGPITTTASTRRPRINYEDDDDDDDDDDNDDNYSSKSIGLAASKKSRLDNDQMQKSKRLHSENDEESQPTNTFSIFKRVANKKSTR
jgi:hypothetical protein